MSRFDKTFFDRFIAAKKIGNVFLGRKNQCFLTDLMGFLILIPFTRKIFFKLAFKNKSMNNIKKENETIDGEIIENKKDET